MALNDLPLHGSPPPPRPSRPASSPTRWIIVAAAVVIAGSFLALRWMIRSQPEPATPTPTRATDAGVPPRRPRSQPVDLPPLDQSDIVVAGMIHALSAHPLVTKLIGSAGLVRQVTLVVQQIGDGKTPADPLKALRPASRLNIVGTDQGPIDAAYRDLGHPNGDFDEAVVRAIQTLAATPDVKGNPELMRHPDRPGYFEHVDSRLASVLPVQKQFLLIGPDNRQRVLAWLKSLAAALDLKID